MNTYNPYIVSLSVGFFVFMLTKSSNKKDENKTKRQTNLNYVFLASLSVFILMQYFSTNTTSIEPTLDCKFDE